MKAADRPADPVGGIQRILVALDASRQSNAALEAAAALAETMQAELEGVFVEDIELLHLAELPFSREIGFTSSSRRALDSAAMARSLRVRASQARAMLESVSARHKVVSSFRVTRGNVLTELLAATEEVDMVAIGTGGHRMGYSQQGGSTYSGMVQSCRCSVLVLQDRTAPGGSVVVLFDGSDASMRALELAKSLASSHHDPLVVILLEGSNDAGKLEKLAVRAIGDFSDVQFRDLSMTQLAGVRKILDKLNCGVFLLPRPISRSIDAFSVEKLTEFRCPVMLLP